MRDFSVCLVYATAALLGAMGITLGMGRYSTPKPAKPQSVCVQRYTMPVRPIGYNPSREQCLELVARVRTAPPRIKPDSKSIIEEICRACGTYKDELLADSLPLIFLKDLSRPQAPRLLRDVAKEAGISDVRLLVEQLYRLPTPTICGYVATGVSPDFTIVAAMLTPEERSEMVYLPGSRDLKSPANGYEVQERVIKSGGDPWLASSSLNYLNVSGVWIGTTGARASELQARAQKAYAAQLIPSKKCVYVADVVGDAHKDRVYINDGAVVITPCALSEQHELLERNLAEQLRLLKKWKTSPSYSELQRAVLQMRNYGSYVNVADVKCNKPSQHEVSDAELRLTAALLWSNYLHACNGLSGGIESVLKETYGSDIYALAQRYMTDEPPCDEYEEFVSNDASAKYRAAIKEIQNFMEDACTRFRRIRDERWNAACREVVGFDESYIYRLLDEGRSKEANEASKKLHEKSKEMSALFDARLEADEKKFESELAQECKQFLDTWLSRHPNLAAELKE